MGMRLPSGSWSELSAYGAESGLMSASVAFARSRNCVYDIEGRVAPSTVSAGRYPMRDASRVSACCASCDD